MKVLYIPPWGSPWPTTLFLGPCIARGTFSEDQLLVGNRLKDHILWLTDRGPQGSLSQEAGIGISANELQALGLKGSVKWGLRQPAIFGPPELRNELILLVHKEEGEWMPARERSRGGRPGPRERWQEWVLSSQVLGTQVLQYTPNALPLNSFRSS